MATNIAETSLTGTKSTQPSKVTPYLGELNPKIKFVLPVFERTLKITE